MQRIKATIIEAVIIIFHVLLFGVLYPKINDKPGALLSIELLLIIVAVAGRIVETVIDHTLCKNTARSGFISRMKRAAVCFVLTAVISYPVMIAWGHICHVSAMPVAYVILGVCCTLDHMFISAVIDKVLNSGDTYRTFKEEDD